MNINSKTIRVLALIPPIERHIGHWARSSPSIDLVRLVMDGEDLKSRLLTVVREHQPQVIAIIGKHTVDYLDMLDELTAQAPQLQETPRVYRCQNTSFSHRMNELGGTPNREFLATQCGWFNRSCEPRWSLVLVQTLDDVDMVGRLLAPTPVAFCPFGFDPEVFDPDFPELDRVTDVGCYMSLRDDPHRVELVERTREICDRRGWTFRFVEGKYWHDYATQIRTTKVCLHRSAHQEVPYRMYETMALGSLFLTDPLRYGVDRFFELGGEYLTYQRDLSDLETTLEQVLTNPLRWESIRSAGKARAARYSWADVAEAYVAPALHKLLEQRVESFT